MKNKDTIAKIISIFLAGCCCFFFAAHISQAVNNCGKYQNILEVLGDHLKNAPFDLKHFHPVVYLYAAGIWAVGSITILCMRMTPKADMKGIEKGSNNFMTEKELKEFLKNNTTRCR